MLRYWIWLSQRKYLNSRDKVLLLEHFGTPEGVYLADEYSYRRAFELSDRKLESLGDKSTEEAERILRLCDEHRVNVLTWQDASYPMRLKNIADPPLVLYFEGRLPHFDEEVVIGVVGTRNASAYGLKNAKELGYQLGRGGAVVVSGCAAGVDRSAMEGALSSGKTVVGVLGNGTDVIYPSGNRNLYEDIRANGCLLSEYPPGTSPAREYFPARNRLISGLAVGVLVVEAPRASGALITARLALEQGRDVFTIPGNLGVPSLEGNLQLLKDGAILVENGSDVLREYSSQYSGVTDQRIPGDFDAPEPAPEPGKPETQEKKSIDKEENTNYIDLKDALSDASPEGAAILWCLAEGPKHVDNIIDETQIPAAKILAAVTILEIRGHIKRLPGRRFSLAVKQ